MDHSKTTVERVTGEIAHDFNNLVGAILNYTTLIERQTADPGILADLAQIRAAADGCIGLTRQLVALTSSEECDPETTVAQEAGRDG